MRAYKIWRHTSLGKESYAIDRARVAFISETGENMRLLQRVTIIASGGLVTASACEKQIRARVEKGAKTSKARRTVLRKKLHRWTMNTLQTLPALCTVSKIGQQTISEGTSQMASRLNKEHPRDKIYVVLDTGRLQTAHFRHRPKEFGIAGRF